MTKLMSDEDKAVMIGFLYGIQSDFLPADEVRRRMAGFRTTKGYKEAIDLINTQKRLYAEMLIGSDWVNPSSDVQLAINEEHDRQRARIK